MISRYARRCGLLAVAVLLSAAIAPRETAVNASDNPAAEESIAAQEVRIRKLHLVRPDLIPYPLYYEVLC